MHEAINNFIDILVCPVSGSKLFVEEDYLTCDLGHKYEIFENVINFTGKLTTNYDQHWSRFESSPMKINRSEDFFNWSTQRITKKIKFNVLDLGLVMVTTRLISVIFDILVWIFLNLFMI